MTESHKDAAEGTDPTQLAPATPGATQAVHLDARATLADYEAAGFEPLTLGDDAFIVTYDNFVGPLDLVLFLVRKHRFDLFNLNIAALLDEYLKWLDRARDFNIDVAAAYIEMAATLAHIKSRMLLPPTDSPVESDEPPPDPRLELVQQLLLVQKYQDAARKINELPWLGRDTFSRQLEVVTGERGDAETLARVAAVDLVKIFVALSLAREEKITPREVFAEEVSVSERIAELVDRFRGKPHARFTELFTPELTRDDRILTFLAILELGKLRMLKIKQSEGGEFWVEFGVLGELPADLETQIAGDASS